MRAKRIIAKAVQKAGWQYETEARGVAPDGAGWRADVLATKDKAKVAFEVQWTNLTWDEAVARQRRYKDSGIRGLWLFKQRNFPVLKETPAFLLEDQDDDSFLVTVGYPDEVAGQFMEGTEPQRIDLEKFIEGALARQLMWKPLLHDTDLWVEISYRPVRCKACGFDQGSPYYLHVFPTGALDGYRHFHWTWQSFDNGWVERAAKHADEHHQVHIGPQCIMGDVKCLRCGRPDVWPVGNDSDGRTLRMQMKLGQFPVPRRGSKEWKFVYRWWFDPELF